MSGLLAGLGAQERTLRSIGLAIAALFAIYLFLSETRLHQPTRALVGVLVALQVIWGLDAPFIPSHAMLGDTVLKHTTTLLSAGYRKSYAEQLHVPGMAEVASHLPGCTFLEDERVPARTHHAPELAHRLRVPDALDVVERAVQYTRSHDAASTGSAVSVATRKRTPGRPRSSTRRLSADTSTPRISASGKCLRKNNSVRPIPQPKSRMRAGGLAPASSHRARRSARR